MDKKHIHINNLVSIAKRKELEILSNIHYKNFFHPKDRIRIKHTCGKLNTLKIKDFLKYVCTCEPDTNNKISRICTLCEKPHRVRSQLCSSCNEKKKEVEVSIRKLVYLKEYYNV
ncbi:hypothetical protein CLFO_20700 [Clostridium formicaceticum]|uniref:Uncharacterized protein n=1 Tax=Clostridium formicaceticum TaxID=1497 RepID=A0AAC9RLT3_9CLOT|nr:hypothetical protein BJL90_15635 [Clostridium formicaceticum]ARE87670.1 hypothetical protein CLFO_20700 [Clostridium formicaceticum]